MRMVSRSWQNCLEARSTKLSPGVGFLSIFLPRGRNFAKMEAGNLTALKKFPGGQPRGGGCWCLELPDALNSTK